MQVIVKPAARALAVVLLVLAGCGATAPSPSPVPAHTFDATTSPTIGPTAFASPSPSPSASKPAVVDLPLAIHQIPAAYAGHVSALISLGHEVVWSGGELADDNNLLRYVPGADEPEVLFQNPRRNSYLTSIAGSVAGYVFTDDRWVNGEPRGWALWYMAAAGVEPILLDQSTDDRLPSPTLAMNDRYICWEVVHGTWDDRVNELRIASVNDPTAAITLLSRPGRDMYIEFPSLWVDELWYGIVDNDWDAGAEYPRVEMIDLRNPAATPAIFGQDQRAFMPAASSDVVVWKSGGKDGSNALNSGVLTIYRRESGQIQALPIPGPSRAADRVSYPSVGDRFVAWWDDIRQRFYVYDLDQEQFRRIAEYDWATDELVTRPSVSGDLLTYVHSLDEDHRALEWTRLPD
jgi:hypothetical protein